MAALIVAGMLIALSMRDRFAAQELTGWIASFGLLAPLAFFAVRIAAAVVLVPASIMALGAGAAFGMVDGAIYNLVSSTLGAILAFVIARFIAREEIHERIRSRTSIAKIIDGVEAEGWRFVAFVRLVPLFPYGVANYAFGLTRIPLTHYALATLICMIPGDLAFVYMGYAARETLAGNESAWQLGLTALAALAALAFLPRLVRRFRRQPANAAESANVETNAGRL